MSAAERLEAIAGEMITAGLDYHAAKREFGRLYLIAALKASGGNACRASERCGVHRNSIARLLPELPSVRRWIQQVQR